MICKLENLPTIVKKENVNVAVISYGGCCSNTLVEVLEKNGYTCRTEIYDKILCHCPKYVDLNIPVIYLYENPIKALLSMKRRGKWWWDVNQQKMSNNQHVSLSNEKLLQLMIKQFHSWTNQKRHNVLIVKSEELFKIPIANKLSFFLKKIIRGVPIQYIEPKTNLDIDSLDSDIIELFEKYKDEIDTINDFSN